MTFMENQKLYHTEIGYVKFYKSVSNPEEVWITNGAKDKWGDPLKQLVKVSDLSDSKPKPKLTKTPRHIVDIIASRTPAGQGNTQTAEFLTVMKVFSKIGSVRMSIKPEHEDFVKHQARYEKATGKEFTPEFGGEREDEPLRLNCTLPTSEAVKLGLPIFNSLDEARAAGHDTFYLTPFFGSTTEVLIGGRRYAIGWFAIEDLGMYIGGPDAQDSARIEARLASFS